MAKPSHTRARQGRRRTPTNGAIRAKSHVPAPAVWAPRVSPVAPPVRPDDQAVLVFQQAMESMQRHDYRGAADRFRGLLTAFPSERALLDRARVYLALCERELGKRPQAPSTPEEKVTAATAALNDGREDEAERLARSVLDDRPDHDLALYLLAAIHARRGDPDGALDWLIRATEISPDVRAQARHDQDFEALRDLDQFRRLVDGPVSAQSGARRQRRPRADR